jgi:hypothetical protein
MTPNLQERRYLMRMRVHANEFRRNADSQWIIALNWIWCVRDVKSLPVRHSTLYFGEVIRAIIVYTFDLSHKKLPLPTSTDNALRSSRKAKVGRAFIAALDLPVNLSDAFADPPQ